MIPQVRDPRILRVVHIITKMELGGAQLNTLYTYENLNPDRFDTYLIGGAGGILNRMVRKTSNFFVVKALVRAVHPMNDMRALHAIGRILRQLSPHIVHTHSSKAGILGRIAAHKAGIPIRIHSVHGFSFSPYQSHVKRLMYQSIEKRVAPLTTHFVFVAGHDIETARNLNLIKGNYSLIRSGFPFQEIMAPGPGRRELEQRFHIPPNQFVCGIIAPFKPQKGLEHVIDIAERVVRRRPDVIFFLAGDGRLRKKIETSLMQRGLADHFRLPGFIRPVGPVLNLFDCGLTTALWEGLPQSLVQFRLKRIPVLASDIPGNREIVRHGVNGFLIAVGDHDTFSNAIVRLRDRPAERARLGNHMEDYSEWAADTMVSRQEELYEHLAQKYLAAMGP